MNQAAADAKVMVKAMRAFAQAEEVLRLASQVEHGIEEAKARLEAAAKVADEHEALAARSYHEHEREMERLKAKAREEEQRLMAVARERRDSMEAQTARLHQDLEAKRRDASAECDRLDAVLGEKRAVLATVNGEIEVRKEILADLKKKMEGLSNG